MSLKIRALVPALAITAAAGLGQTASAAAAQHHAHPVVNRAGGAGRVFIETNDAKRNAIVAFARAPGGSLRKIGVFPTGGRGSGALVSSSNFVVLTDDHRYLLAGNLGDNTVSVFRVTDRGLRLTDRVRSGGAYPDSIAIRDDLVYVLDNGLTDPNGTGAVHGFRLRNGHLTPISGAAAPLSQPAFTAAAQVGFSPDGKSLLVTEEATDTIDTYGVEAGGQLNGPTAVHSAGQTPFGFEFTPQGNLLVSDANHGTLTAASVSSYRFGAANRSLTPVSSAVPDTQSEVCWVVITKNQRFAYVSNFGSSTISTYAIGHDGTVSVRKAVAADTEHSQTVRVGLRDEALSSDSRYLYTMDIDTGNVRGWQINQKTGALHALPSTGRLSDSLAGLAAF